MIKANNASTTVDGNMEKKKSTQATLEKKHKTIMVLQLWITSCTKRNNEETATANDNRKKAVTTLDSNMEQKKHKKPENKQ